MLCLGAPGLGTPCCGSSGVRGLRNSNFTNVAIKNKPATSVGKLESAAGAVEAEDRREQASALMCSAVTRIVDFGLLPTSATDIRRVRIPTISLSQLPGTRSSQLIALGSFLLSPNDRRTVGRLLRRAELRQTLCTLGPVTLATTGVSVKSLESVGAVVDGVTTSCLSARRARVLGT